MVEHRGQRLQVFAVGHFAGTVGLHLDRRDQRRGGLEHRRRNGRQLRALRVGGEELGPGLEGWPEQAPDHRLQDVVSPGLGLLHGCACCRVGRKEGRVGNYQVEPAKDLARAADLLPVDLHRRDRPLAEPQLHHGHMRRRGKLDHAVRKALDLQGLLDRDAGVGAVYEVEPDVHGFDRNRSLSRQIGSIRYGCGR